MGFFSLCANSHWAHSLNALNELRMCTQKSTLSTLSDDFKGTVSRKFERGLLFWLRRRVPKNAAFYADFNGGKKEEKCLPRANKFYDHE